jgi:hypothetical protein
VLHDIAIGSILNAMKAPRDRRLFVVGCGAATALGSTLEKT